MQDGARHGPAFWYYRSGLLEVVHGLTSQLKKSTEQEKTSEINTLKQNQ